MGCLTLYFVHLRLYSYIMITHIRVASQQLEQPRFESPKELVSWMGAIQAQEYEMAKWAIGIRLRSSSLETANGGGQNARPRMRVVLLRRPCARS